MCLKTVGCDPAQNLGPNFNILQPQIDKVVHQFSVICHRFA